MKSLAKSLIRRAFRSALCRWPGLVLTNPKVEQEDFHVSIPLEFTIGGREIVVPIDNQRHYNRWQRLQERSKEQDTIRWITEEMNDRTIFYDIGANVGNYTVLAGLLHDGARILAFEPEPNSFLALCRVIYRNRIRAVPYPFALSSKTEVQEFRIHRAFAAALANHQLGRDIDQHGNKFEAVFSVGTISLTVDRLVQDFGLPSPTHVKIDVDGLEPEVVEGMERTLASGSVQSILTEMSGKEAIGRVRTILARHGFVAEGGGKVQEESDEFRTLFRRVS